MLVLLFALEQHKQGITELDDILDQGRGMGMDNLVAIMADFPGLLAGRRQWVRAGIVGVVAQQQVRSQRGCEQCLLQGFCADTEVMSKVVEATFKFVPA